MNTAEIKQKSATAVLLNILKYVLVLGVGAVLLFLAFRNVNLKNTIDEISQADFFWLIVSVVMSLIAFFSRAIRWNMLINPLGYNPDLKNTSAALMTGYLANLAVPRLGEVTRCGTLSRAENIPFDSLIGTVIIERIIDVLSLLACIIFVALTEYERLGNFLTQNIFNPMMGKFRTIINSPLIIVAICSVIIICIILFIKRKKGEGTLSGKVSKLLKGIMNGVDSVRRLKSPAAFLFHTILIWTMYFLMSYTCFFALQATSGLDWHAGVFVLVVGGMGMSAPVQGGIGAYHLLVSQGLLLYGITQEHGLAFATLMHTTQTLTVILFGAFAFLYLFLKRKNASVQHTRLSEK